MTTSSAAEYQHLVTAEELFKRSSQRPCELVKGKIRGLEYSDCERGCVAANLAVSVACYVTESRLGYVFGAGTGFIIQRDPDTVRAPDVAFVVADRVADRLPTQFFPGPPDLAVEVLSPSDTASEVQEKAEAWLVSGCKEVWLVDPRRKTATKLTPAENSIVQQTVETLTTELLPGFSLAVAELFK